MSELPVGQIICGDCREVMRGWPDGCFDAVVTDPPYGIGWTRGTWDDDPEQYAELMRWLVAEANRVTGGGAVFVWQALPNLCHFHEWFPDGFRVFAACKGFVQYRPTPVQWSWDPVVFWGNIKCEEPSVYRKDFWVNDLAPFGAHRERIDHPCPKPEPTVARVVSLACPPGGLVLDPFMGSGTTAVACVQTGRRFVGIELDPGYCEVARRRVAGALLQPRLDFEKATPPRQEVLL